MDNQFNSSYLPYSQSQQSPAQQAPHMGSYSLPGQASSQQQQQQASQSASTQQSPAQQDASHPTLPPLQSAQNGYAHFGSMSYAHSNNSGAPTPTTAHTPTSSSIANGTASAYSHVSPASAMGPPNAYAHYPMSQSMLYPSPTSTTPLPPSNGLQALRPAIATSLAPLSSLSAPHHLGQQTSFLQNEEAPTHVVGSQGRRGILPSAPGRPPATSQGAGSSIKNMMPQKDADGKYPCLHCNKQYLHAKHLKRHMLRHTGDRPYSCHLCKDTFSRSDILKRHFQKCSIRRGNPTGANHLAHQRRGNNSNRLSMTQQDGPIGLAGLQEVTGGYNNGGLSDNSPTVTGDVSTRSSRANSLISPASMSHRNSIAGLGILGNGGAGEQMSNGQSFAPNMHGYGLPSVSNGNQVPSAYAFSQQPINGAYFSNPSVPQPLSFLNHATSRFDHNHSNSPHQQSPNGDANHAHLEQNRIFNQNSQDGFMNGNVASGASSQNNENIKSEHDQKHFPNDLGNDMSGNGGIVWS
ncbi:hypothetical protein AMS68_005769 [Peltaster fructicola]|uniref:C2H2-type domain-containing protein n=1 Tax=Peltaster fructicola TaxID=286661 RepID=A0A6H0XZQ0_9PEZI|nr:hypothetical protein AMS68_005769 [Peltaster fructicola]